MYCYQCIYQYMYTLVLIIDSEICNIDVSYCLKLTPGLLSVHNTNYIYMVLLYLFLSSFSQYYDRHLTVDDRTTSCNIIPHDVWVEFRWSVANYLRIVYHCHILQIHHMEWPAGSFSRTSCSPITDDYTDL